MGGETLIRWSKVLGAKVLRRMEQFRGIAAEPAYQPRPSCHARTVHGPPRKGRGGNREWGCGSGKRVKEETRGLPGGGKSGLGETKGRARLLTASGCIFQGR